MRRNAYDDTIKTSNLLITTTCAGLHEMCVREFVSYLIASKHVSQVNMLVSMHQDKGDL
jgi:hypothetical protein